ncbi:MAG TPA: ATP-binding protein [Chloroflexota bacterium]|nr:ATP-binding protein [Chloroflexota bacterium]
MELIVAVLVVLVVVVLFTAMRNRQMRQLRALNAELDSRVLALTEDFQAQLGAVRARESLLDLAPDGILVRGFVSKAILFWNHGAELMYGWSKEEADGRNPHELLKTEFPRPLDDILADLVRDDHWEGELRHTRKDGSRVWVYSRWTLQRDESGAPKAFLEINTDIGSQKRAEQERAAREAAEAVARRTALLADSSRVFGEARLDAQSVVDAVATWITDAIGDGAVIRLVSDDGQSLSAVAVRHRDPEPEAYFRRLNEEQVHTPEDLPFRDVLRTGRATRIEEVDWDSFRAQLLPQHRAYVDRFRAYSLLALPLRARGRVIGIMVLRRDSPGRPYTKDDEALLQNVADRAALAIENANLYQEAIRALGVRDEFLAVAAHELKTPLTALRLASDMLLRVTGGRGLDGVQARRLAERIHDRSVKLSDLVNELLSVSRIESGALSLSRERTDIVALVRSVLEGLPDRERHPIRLSAPDQADAWVDPMRVEQVILNLVTNAQKFSPAGSPIEIEIASAPGETVCVSVRDHGIGVPEEHRGHIFERFFQAKTQGHVEGMGLGLYISREIVKQHGGTLRAEFPPDGGLRIVATFPSQPTDEADGSVVIDGEPSKQPA